MFFWILTLDNKSRRKVNFYQKKALKAKIKNSITLQNMRLGSLDKESIPLCLYQSVIQKMRFVTLGEYKMFEK